MIGFRQFITESDNWEKWITGLKKGSSTCYVFDGPRDSGKVYRSPKGHLIWDNNKFDKEFATDQQAIDWLKTNKYKYVGVDSINDDEDDD